MEQEEREENLEGKEDNWRNRDVRSVYSVWMYTVGLYCCQN
jgi:hypothetical protein